MFFRSFPFTKSVVCLSKGASESDTSQDFCRRRRGYHFQIRPWTYLLARGLLGKPEQHVHEIQAAVKTDSRKGFQFVMYYPMLYRCRRIEDTVVYMEVYGSNRVIYRVTAGWVVRPDGTAKSVYGICLEDLRSGEQQALEDFSDTLDQTILFANHLVEQEIRPEELYDAALKQLSHQVLSSRRIFSR